MRKRTLTLNPQHLAKVARVVDDAGPPPGMVLHSDSDYDEWVKRILETNPSPASPIRLFAYGSLIWKPELEYVTEDRALARGWHRAFCFKAPRFRGTPEQPGLMMALDRGGQAWGVVYELPRENITYQLNRLFRREFTAKPPNSMPRWITVETSSGRIQTLTFAMNRASPLYAGRLPLQSIAQVLAKACGHWGSGAEYLFNTVSHLEAKGIHDRNLWTLQRLVAEEIDRMERLPE
jgi:cation transport protein ChaC